MLKAMRASSLRTALLIILSLSAVASMAGCKSRADTFTIPANSASWNASKLAARAELGEIHIASRSAYLAVGQESQWQNPFLSVGSNMIQLRIYLADENQSPLDRGGLTRLNAARKQVLNVRLEDLPEALSSLPASAWPYGRVVAIDEKLEPPPAHARLENNLRVTVNALKEMNVAVDEWNSRGLPQ